jgi:hypothetical protein
MSNLSPRHFTALVSWIVLLKRASYIPLSTERYTVLLGLMDRVLLLHHHWGVHRDICKTSDIIRRNSPLIRIAIISVSYRIMSSQRRPPHDQAPPLCRHPQGLICLNNLPGFGMNICVTYLQSTQINLYPMQALTIPPVPADLNGLKVLNGHLVSD